MSNDIPNKVQEKTRVALKALGLYHRHEAYGLANIPKVGPGLIVVNHSLATYDGFMMGMTVFEKTGRLVKGLGDRMLFKLPITKTIMPELGVIPASPENAKELLKQGELVALAPGGMREALRARNRRYQVDWADRQGFARLSVETQVPIILAACPKADDIFDVYASPLTNFLYNKFKIPLPLFRGVGPTLIPRPVKLVHTFGRPLQPPSIAGLKEEEKKVVIEKFHQKIMREMEKMMKNNLKKYGQQF